MIRVGRLRNSGQFDLLTAGAPQNQFSVRLADA
jgi:hypothetical protein